MPCITQVAGIGAGLPCFLQLLLAMTSNAAPARADKIMKDRIGVLFGVVAGAVYVRGGVAVAVLVSPPVTMVGDEVDTGVPGDAEGMMRRREMLSMSPSATALGFSKSPIVER
jgi:hypothetical protein